MRAGINANWLLTGEGPMLLADMGAPALPSPPLDQERLQAAIDAVEQGLSAAKATMAPGKKAQLILAVYELLEEPAVSRDRVLKLIKFAA